MSFVTYSSLHKNGRIGNQLFQISSSISYALEHGKDFVFPEWKYSKYMRRPLPVGTAPADRITNEPTFYYSPIPKMDGNVDLGGYYQSALHFEKHFRDILPYITLNDHYHNYLMNKYGDVLANQTCSIHVRHGDYLHNPVHRDYHGVLPIVYYQQAIDRLYGPNYENITFMIFSDDMDWCKDNFKLPNQIFVEGEEDVLDLFLGSYCFDHIIANSSFSWWQSYLGMASAGRTVAPRRWFMPKAGLNTKDLYCKEWIII